MANFVTKKDGTKVPFDSEKIKSGVMSAALEAGLSNEEATATAEKILSSVQMAFGSQEEVATSDIRDKILAELDASQPAVSGAWRKYEESKG